MAEVGMIGAGSWGTALSLLLYNNGNNVTVWSILEDEIRMLKEEHEQKDKLPGVRLPENMVFTTDLEAAIKGKDVLVLAVPSPFTRSTAAKMAPFVTEGQKIVNVAKGIEIFEPDIVDVSSGVEKESGSGKDEEKIQQFISEVRKIG